LGQGMGQLNKLLIRSSGGRERQLLRGTYLPQKYGND
jgi:hypothetical protein